MEGIIISDMIERIEGDSKSDSKKALRELIDFCEPLIQKYYDAIGEFLDENTHMMFGQFMSIWFSNYNSSDDIEDFLGFDKERNVLRFHGSYDDGIVEMPIQWLDIEQFEMNMRNIKEKVLNEYIEMQKRQIDDYRHYIEIHEEEIRKSEAKLEELHKKDNNHKKQNYDNTDRF